MQRKIARVLRIVLPTCDAVVVRVDIEPLEDQFGDSLLVENGRPKFVSSGATDIVRTLLDLQ